MNLDLRKLPRAAAQEHFYLTDFQGEHSIYALEPQGTKL